MFSYIGIIDISIFVEIDNFNIQEKAKHPVDGALTKVDSIDNRVFQPKLTFPSMYIHEKYKFIYCAKTRI